MGEPLTFALDDDLPSLPLPSLRGSADLYLRSVAAVVEEDEFRHVESLVNHFVEHEGAVYHSKLMEKSKKEKNWLERWWMEVVYLQWRKPLAPLMSMGGIQPLWHTSSFWPPQPGSQLDRAAIYLHVITCIWTELRHQRFPVHRSRNGDPFSMDQYRRIFNTTRIPGAGVDELRQHFRPASEGETPNHVIVISRGRIFEMAMTDSEERPFTPPQLHDELKKIKDYGDKFGAGPGVGALTALPRDSWHATRSRLLSSSPAHKEAFDKIESAVFVLVLEDKTIQSEQELVFEAVAGSDPGNRWFDKSFTEIVSKNGVLYQNAEHTPVDGLAHGVITEMTTMMLKRMGGVWDEEEHQDSEFAFTNPSAKELLFRVDEETVGDISEGRRLFKSYSDDIDFVYFEFRDFGRDFVKPYRLYPDSWVQMALQLAYYLKYLRPAPTYESATTRRYYHGRTETIRSCTPEAVRFCETMISVRASQEDRYVALESAIHAHHALLDECQRGFGCDRHFLGLYLTTKQADFTDTAMTEVHSSIPAFMTHPSWEATGGGGNFVLSTSCTGYWPTVGIVTPMCQNGYGAFYSLNKDYVGLVVTAWKSCQDTDAQSFALAFERAMRLMHGVVIDTRGSQVKVATNSAKL